MRSTCFYGAKREQSLVIEHRCTYLELPCLLELSHVALALERTSGGQEDVLVIAVDVLRPSGKPSDRVVVLNVFPFARYVGLGDGHALADVDRDVLWTDAFLNGARSVSTPRRRTHTQYTTFSVPFLGCSPRPRYRPGGSTLKFPTFSFLPSMIQCVNGASSSSFFAFNSFFSADVSAFFFAFSASKYSYIGRKSQRERSVILVPSRCGTLVSTYARLTHNSNEPEDTSSESP